MRADSIAMLTSEVQAFCRARDWDQFHTPKELAIGIATEASELLATLRFLDPEQIRDRLLSSEGRIEIEHEVADTFFFLLRFCERCEVDLADALRKKLVVNEARYPVDRSRGRNEKYDRL